MAPLRLNVRRYEQFCCYLTTLFPKALTSGLYVYGLYGLIFELCIPLIGGVKGFVIASLGLLIFAQGVYTYFKVISAGPGSPLDFPELRSHEGVGDVGEEEPLTRETPDDVETQIGTRNTITDPPPQFLVDHSVQVKSNGRMRYCNKCACWKPDRCHHCSTCNRCQLKMDHHCPWFASCVGFRNHKFFIQFLLLSVVYANLIFFASAAKLYSFFMDEEYLEDYISINLLILGILSFTMSISVGLFTLMTLYLLLRNTTTIESQDASRYRNNMSIIEDSYYKYSRQPNSSDMGNVYNLGFRGNWCAVMGSSWYEWVLPVFNRPSGDRYKDNGLYFDTDRQIYNKLQQNTRVQQQLLEQLNGLQ
ncbi:CYFA0S44e00122g1_1 [Cyberlindnera fabianii]|uniref:Palmitoyltransferase n=1 Tax=Cyberlindnera fabianii TaxID=36022 RepID=A0A061BF67_CYBFA|nr:CYFA0S44e00122g1_1 [Cyberlindnera fabianii]